MWGVDVKFWCFPTFTGRGRIYFLGGGAVGAQGGGGMVRRCGRVGWRQDGGFPAGTSIMVWAGVAGVDGKFGRWSTY